MNRLFTAGHGNALNKLLLEDQVQDHHVFQDERFVDLNLYQYGWEQTEPLHSYGPYARNHYLFHYVISGKGLLLANEQEYAIEGGQGFLIAPGQVTTYRADEQEPWELVKRKSCLSLAAPTVKQRWIVCIRWQT